MNPASLLFATVARAITWPDGSAWEPVLHEGAPLEDVCDDASGSDWWDVVGDADDPVAFTVWDGTHLWFRLRVADAPYHESGGTPDRWNSFGWGVLIESDWDGRDVKYDHIVFVDGNSDEVSLAENTVGSANFTTDAPETVLRVWPAPLAEVGSGTEEYAAYVAAGSDVCGGGEADFFLDWAIPWADLASATGASDPSDLGLVFGTSASAETFDKDLAGCDATKDACDDWGDQVDLPDGDTGDTAPPDDTAPTDDTAIPDDTAPPRPGLYLGGACGCTPAGPGGSAWLLLALAALARRRP